MNVASKTAVIVEDDDLCSSALQFQIERQGYIVLSVCKKRCEAIEKCKSLKPSLVVLDYYLEIGTGLEVWDSLRFCMPELKSVFVIPGISNSNLSEILESKPSSIIEKCQIDQIRHALSAAESDGFYYSGDVWKRVSMYNNTMYSLSEKERNVFRMLVNKNSSEFIADKIGKSVRHVRNYKYNIIQKIGRGPFEMCCSSTVSKRLRH